MNPIFKRGKERRRGKGKRQRVGEERGGKEVVECTKGRIEERREKRKEGKERGKTEQRGKKRREKKNGREEKYRKRREIQLYSQRSVPLLTSQIGKQKINMLRWQNDHNRSGFD